MQSLHFFFQTVSMFGDSGFVLPVTGGLFAALLVSGDRRTAWALLGAVATCAILTIAVKIAFMVRRVADIHSPSGHASMATVFFSALGLFAARSGRGWRGPVGAAICALLVASVAVSRVALDAHSASETVIGVAIGLFSFVLFLRFESGRPLIGAGRLAILLAVLLPLYAAFGVSVTLEEPLERIAARIGRMLQP